MMKREEWPIMDRPRPEDVMAARVVPAFWVAVDYIDGHRHCAYPIGTAEAAAAEVRRLMEQSERLPSS
jgi:hypothetical protein